MSRLDEIRARLDAATPGSWFDKPNDLIGGRCVMPVDATPATVQVPEVADFCRDEDAALIAHAGGDDGDLYYLLDHYELLIEAARAAIIRCREGDPRSDWLPTIDSILTNALPPEHRQ